MNVIERQNMLIVKYQVSAYNVRNNLVRKLVN